MTRENAGFCSIEWTFCGENDIIINMEYLLDKEYALKCFRSQVASEYLRTKKEGLPLVRLLGEIVENSQGLEYSLKEKIKTDVCLEQKHGKQLVDLLDENNYFNLDESKRKSLISKIKNVIECRNWAIHCANLELSKKDVDCFDKIFLAIARATKLFQANPNPIEIMQGKFCSTGGLDELKININNQWSERALVVDFNRDIYAIEDPTISIHMDWVIVKAIITKYLIWEVQDLLNENFLSIYANG
jgi:hypothetical protein